jgi:steroid delta-isomerase-like uncharacterized protein
MSGSRDAKAAHRVQMSLMGRELAQKLVAAVESRDADALAELCAEDAVLHHPLSPEPAKGRAAIAASEQSLFEAFSEVEVELLRVVAEGDDVAVEVVVRATNTGPLEVGPDERLPPTGRRIELPSVWLLRLGSGGKIVEERDYLDTASFFRQLGLADDA